MVAISVLVETENLNSKYVRNLVLACLLLGSLLSCTISLYVQPHLSNSIDDSESQVPRKGIRYQLTGRDVLLATGRCPTQMSS
jgi:hypothetical protein